jgi:hypothetical protein
MDFTSTNTNFFPKVDPDDAYYRYFRSKGIDLGEGDQTCSSLDDLDQLLNGRRRPGDDEAVGGVVRDDPNPGWRDPPEGVRHFASQRIFEGDQLDGDGFRGESFGRSDPHAPGAADEPVPVQGESRLQELERLRRRDALRRKNGNLPFDLFRIEEKRDSRELANVPDDGRDLGVLETERFRGDGSSRLRGAHDENAQ